MNTFIDVRYVETDKMGVVHHSNYAIWFEVARIEWFRSIGLDYRVLEEEGLMLPLIEMNLQFKRPAKFGDKVLISTSLGFLNGVRLEISYLVKNGDDGSILAEGMTHHVWANHDFKPVNIKKFRLDIYDKIMSLYNNDN